MRKQASFHLFKRKPFVQKDRYELWKGVAGLLSFATHERLRVERMVFYETLQTVEQVRQLLEVGEAAGFRGPTTQEEEC
jgi:hypothetical protein